MSEPIVRQRIVSTLREGNLTAHLLASRLSLKLTTIKAEIARLQRARLVKAVRRVSHGAMLPDGSMHYMTREMVYGLTKTGVQYAKAVEKRSAS